jgi:hypothetical protein
MQKREHHSENFLQNSSATAALLSRKSQTSSLIMTSIMSGSVRQGETFSKKYPATENFFMKEN